MLVVQHCRGRVVTACSPATPNERGILQWCKLFARLLQSGAGLTRLHSPLHQPVAWHAMPRHGARLRAALAFLFGKANAVEVNCFTGGATHQWEAHGTHQFSQGLGPSYKAYFTYFCTGLEVLVKVG